MTAPGSWSRSITTSAPSRTRANSPAKSLAASASETWIEWLAMPRLYSHFGLPDPVLTRDPQLTAAQLGIGAKGSTRVPDFTSTHSSTSLVRRSEISFPEPPTTVTLRSKSEQTHQVWSDGHQYSKPQR